MESQHDDGLVEHDDFHRWTPTTAQFARVHFPSETAEQRSDKKCGNMQNKRSRMKVAQSAGQRNGKCAKTTWQNWFPVTVEGCAVRGVSAATYKIT